MIYKNEFLEEIWKLSKEFKIQQKKYEWFELLKILNDNNQKYRYGLEVGAYDGGSSISLSHFCDNLITIDGNIPIRFDVDRIKKITNYEGISANSFHNETINYVKNFSPNGYDLIFIDGDHTYDGVKKDFDNYFPMLNKNGVMFFHDIVDSEYHRESNCYVSKMWQEIKNNFEHIEILDPENGDWGGIGLIYKK